MKNFNVIVFLVQFFLTTGILYFGLTYDVEYAGELIEYSQFSLYKQEDTPTNTLEKSESNYFVEDNQKKETDLFALSQRANDLIHEAMQEVYFQSHSAGSSSQDEVSYEKKFQDLCFINLGSCLKIRFDGEFTYKDKYIYLSSILKTLYFVDQKGSFQNSVSKVLEKVTLTQEAGKRRGNSTWDEITINVGGITSYVEFLEVFTHELGHIIDLGVIQGEDDIKDATFTEFGKVVFSQDDSSLVFYAYSFESEKSRKAGVTRKDFVSGYAMYDPTEDFAESFNAYLNHNSYFKYLAKNNDTLRKKYNFIANYFGGKYLYSNDNDLVIVSKNIVWRPYDTTKIK